MKNVRAIVLLLLAVVLGLGAAVYAARLVSQKGNIAANKVVVAAVDIPLGSRIEPNMISTIDWPSSSVPQGAFKEVKALEARVLRTSVTRGEAILDGKLAPVGTKGGLSAVITEGKRAMTVRVNDVVGVAGFALPGNYVDILVNTERDKDRRSISKTVLENVLVLAVAQEASRDDTKPRVVNAVTLELLPEESEKLDLARSVGSLSLVLRNQVDDKPVTTAGVTKTDLFEQNRSAVVRVATTAPASTVVKRPVKRTPTIKPEKSCVEIIQHGQRMLNCF